jgi:prephenate dehydratase
MKKQLIIGIQGGKGSFNEEAVLQYVKKSKLENFEIKYLHTSENVLRELQEGKIDQGQFAIFNTLGGVVHESIDAMGKYQFKLLADYKIKIEHTLMMHKDALIEDIDTIMAHPQVFAQCKKTLAKKYPNLKQVVGEGEFIDHAKVAEGLAKNALPKNIAVMGSKLLAKIYNLQIIENGLQDEDENDTTFLLVQKPNSSSTSSDKSNIIKL